MGSNLKYERDEKGRKKDAVDDAWVRWIMQTARTWEDISSVIRLTGIDTVDEDHKKMTLYALDINKLVSRFEEEGFSLEYLNRQNELLENFYHYTEVHFSNEEALMKPFDFDWYERHKDQHTDILANLRGMIQDFNAGRATTSIKLKLALLEWVAVHINQVDFHDFSLNNWRPMLGRAEKVDDIRYLIKKTGVESVDQEHLDLTTLALEFDHIVPDIDPGTPLNAHQIEKIRDHFNKFYKGVAEHFNNEEKLIKEYDLSGMDEQQEQHRKFIAMVKEYRDGCLSGNIDMLKGLKLEVIEWWITHINQVDYRTFGLGNWSLKVLEKARKWDDVAEFIKIIGIEEIDYYHKLMAEYALALSQLIDKTIDKPDDPNLSTEAADIFNKLYNCAVEHFSMEEKIIKDGYPDALVEQQDQHKDFLAQLRGYRSDFESGKVQLTLKMKVLILDWWVNHINSVDYNTFVVLPARHEMAAASFEKFADETGEVTPDQEIIDLTEADLETVKLSMDVRRER